MYLGLLDYKSEEKHIQDDFLLPSPPPFSPFCVSLSFFSR